MLTAWHRPPVRLPCRGDRLQGLFSLAAAGLEAAMTAIGAEAVAAVGCAVVAGAGAGAGRLMTGVAAPAAAAPCGPREGSSVVRSTKPGVAAILGRPTG